MTLISMSTYVDEIIAFSSRLKSKVLFQKKHYAMLSTQSCYPLSGSLSSYYMTYGDFFLYSQMQPYDIYWLGFLPLLSDSTNRIIKKKIS